MKSPSSSSSLEQRHALPRNMSRPLSASDARSRRLGYSFGLPRSNSQAESFCPHYISDIHSVIENMKVLQESERISIAKEKQARERTFGKNVEITKGKDLCILKFPIDGTRLMVKRWSKGFTIHPPRYRPSLETTVPSRSLGQHAPQGSGIQDRSRCVARESPSPMPSEDVQEQRGTAVGALPERPQQLDPVRQEVGAASGFRGRLAAALDAASGDPASAGKSKADELRLAVGDVLSRANQSGDLRAALQANTP